MTRTVDLPSVGLESGEPKEPCIKFNGGGPDPSMGSGAFEQHTRTCLVMSAVDKFNIRNVIRKVEQRCYLVKRVFKTNTAIDSRG